MINTNQDPTLLPEADDDSQRPASPDAPPPPQAIVNNWDDIPNLSDELLRGIFGYGFEKPSPIQQQAIIPLMAGHDVVAQAQSGTGKTGAFVIGALSRVDVTVNETQVLIISPTKELCTQTAAVVAQIAAHMSPPIRVEIMFGGMIMSSTSQQLRPHVICGCPGRLHDMINKSVVRTKAVKIIVLDEADELLSTKGRNAADPTITFGFKDQIYNIFKTLHSNVQVALFTATMPAYMDPLIGKMMRDPIMIRIVPERLTLDGIKQYFVEVFDNIEKIGVLKQIYAKANISQSIIYCNSVGRVEDLFNALHQEGFEACSIHSNMDKTIRDRNFRDFVSGKFRIMISSDVTARGIDVQQVSLVVNFDVPNSEDTYLHRIGRSGRWGRKGVGINLITPRDVGNMTKIANHYRCVIAPLPADFSI